MNHYLLSSPCDRRIREAYIGGLLMENAFLSRETIGESRCARPVDLLRIGNRKKQVLLAGGFHGMEWLTCAVLLRFADDICNSVRTGSVLCGIRIGTFLNLRGVAIMPCINPDGTEIQLHGAGAAGDYSALVTQACLGDTSKWQANAAGIDINHNFDADWDALHELERKNGISAPAPTRYGGDYPESEPESRCIASYCRAGNITHAIALHSQGEEIYWSFGDYREKEALRMAQAMSAVSGYKLGEAEGLAQGGGFKDWFEQKFHRPAFTIEIGKGMNPLPISDLDSIYEKIREMLVLSLVL